MIYYKKKKIDLKNYSIIVQLDLSEIKEGNYTLTPKEGFISVLKDQKEVAIITPYGNYRKYIEKYPIFIGEVDFKIFKKTLDVDNSQKILVLN